VDGIRFLQGPPNSKLVATFVCNCGNETRKNENHPRELRTVAIRVTNMTDYTILVRADIATNCFLSEALYWRAFGRIPLAYENEKGPWRDNPANYEDISLPPPDGEELQTMNATTRESQPIPESRLCSQIAPRFR
jgi:hypothetical protein